MEETFQKDVREILKRDAKVEKTPKLVNSPNPLVANISGTVDGKMQPLNIVGKSQGINQTFLPSISIEANDVLVMLISCYEKNGRVVKEGLVGDVLWGFQQSGYPPDRTIKGLQDLADCGYLQFQAPDNAYVHLNSSKAGKAWVRYQPSFLKLINVR